ncbi:MAG: tetratricopeptide repeat protein [Bacteroidota bacterium]
MSSTPTDSIQQVAERVKRQQRRLFLVGLLAVLAIVGFFFFKHYRGQQNKDAQSEMFQAVYYFEQEEFDKALNGDGVFAGLLDIVKTYRFTKAAKLAHFYIGVSYMHQHDYEKAIHHLTKFRSKDWLIQARAWVLLGDAHTEQKNYKEAANYYHKATDYRPNKSFTPHYLFKAALAYEAAEQLDKALNCYERIVQEFPEVPQYGEALKHAARLRTLQEQPQESPNQ